MDPFQNRNFKPWTNFLRKNGFSAFIQIRSEDGSIYQADVNDHNKINLNLDSELNVDISSNSCKLVSGLPKLPTSFSLLEDDDMMIKYTALKMLNSLLHDGQLIGNGSFQIWKLQLPLTKFKYMLHEVQTIDEDIITPDHFINWEHLSRTAILEDPDEMHLLVDLPWITILKILIELIYTKLGYNLTTFTIGHNVQHQSIKPRTSKHAIANENISDNKQRRKKGQIPVLVTKSGKYVSPWYPILEPDFDIEAYDKGLIVDTCESSSSVGNKLRITEDTESIKDTKRKKTLEVSHSKKLKSNSANQNQKDGNIPSTNKNYVLKSSIFEIIEEGTPNNKRYKTIPKSRPKEDELARINGEYVTCDNMNNDAFNTPEDLEDELLLLNAIK